MILAEPMFSVSAVDACRWSTKSVPAAPYVTQLPWISHYGCYYCVHGDDITSDSGGEDCYRFVKAADRFLVVKRTPGISTTDLVGRMLLCTKTHFIKSLPDVLAGREGSGSSEERQGAGKTMLQRIKDYASDESGLKPGPEVFTWASSIESVEQDSATGTFTKIIGGIAPKDGQRIVYVDGGFDLFSSGHIEFLKRVSEAENKLEKEQKSHVSLPPYIIAGVHDDETVNRHRGVNYPIMNIFERGLCVLQCRVSHTANGTMTRELNVRTVHQLSGVLCSLRSEQGILAKFAFWHPGCCLSWSDILYAQQRRSICGRKGSGDLSGYWST